MIETSMGGGFVRNALKQQMVPIASSVVGAIVVGTILGARFGITWLIAGLTTVWVGRGMLSGGYSATVACSMSHGLALASAILSVPVIELKLSAYTFIFVGGIATILAWHLFVDHLARQPKIAASEYGQRYMSDGRRAFIAVGAIACIPGGLLVLSGLLLEQYRSLRLVDAGESALSIGLLLLMCGSILAISSIIAAFRRPNAENTGN